MEIPFMKMHGLGNNYIYLDLFKFQLEEKLFSHLAKQIANVNTGIGSDGLILIHPSVNADVGMRIFNKDGSEGKTCGNGLRCTAKYAYEFGIVSGQHFQIETKAGNVQAEVSVNQENIVETITINMGSPRLKRHAIPMHGEDSETVINEAFRVNSDDYRITAVSMGNPHAVFFVKEIENAPLYDVGPKIEQDNRFPEGVNVEFIEVVNDKELNFRVWERGSGVTEACGTGACAATVAGVLNKKIVRNEWVTVHLEGGDLQIRWDYENQVWMSGGAAYIASGVYYY